MGFQTGQNRSKAVKTGQNFLWWWKMDISVVILPVHQKTSFKNKQKNRFQKFSHSNKSTKQYASAPLSVQPTAINHQPSTINHQSSIINHQSSIINHQQTTNHHSPTFTIN
jgi:hypothetical protein